MALPGAGATDPATAADGEGVPMAELLTTAEVARELDLTPAAVRAAARGGRIGIAMQTASGQRLFAREELERVKAERATRRRTQA
jgi:hypothetical protein